MESFSHIDGLVGTNLDFELIKETLESMDQRVVLSVIEK